MARPNVTVIINDESFFVPGTESGASLRAGMPSFHNLIGAVGNTAERKSGKITVDNLNNWISRLKSEEPVGAEYVSDAFSYGGNTFARWGAGPTGSWANEWWAGHNYLQYGGVLIVAGTGADDSIVGPNRLKDKQIPLDVVFAATGGSNSTIGTIASTRQDCVAITNSTGASAGEAANDSGSSDQYNFVVFGRKRHLDIYRAVNNTTTSDYITTNCAADVAGCIARSDKLADPWWSPAGFKRGQILDVVSLQENPNDTEMDTMYDAGVNPVVTYPGEGTVLFGDKTTESDTSTLSRINVSRLFIYLKKTVGAAARAKLFEFNDAETRLSFKNAVDPILRIIRSRRGIYDFKVICDESNNPPSIIDANQFVADVYIKPSKSINFIRLTFTNKNTSDIL
jgi:hypothetical protein